MPEQRKRPCDLFQVVDVVNKKLDLTPLGERAWSGEPLSVSILLIDEDHCPTCSYSSYLVDRAEADGLAVGE
jgi:hypothetical protein